MKFLLSDPLLDNQLKEIKKNIRLSMNGVAADHLQQNGLQYKQNLGVSITRLKEIASAYQQDFDLAQRLWLLGQRETMILATLLMPKDKIDLKTVDMWMESCSNIELAEQLSMNLFSKCDLVNDIVPVLLKSADVIHLSTAYLTIARAYLIISEENIQLAINKAIDLSSTDDFQLIRTIGVAMGRTCRLSKEQAGSVLSAFDYHSKQNPSQGLQSIIDSIQQEMIFLGFN